jgi:hypothetical protein
MLAEIKIKITLFLLFFLIIKYTCFLDLVLSILREFLTPLKYILGADRISNFPSVIYHQISWSRATPVSCSLCLSSCKASPPDQ